MTKTMTAVSIATALMVSSAQAATLEFKVGGDYWNADASGSFAQHGQTAQTFDYDSSSRYSLWFAIEHPVPFLPNLKIRENHLEEDGTLANADMTFTDIDFSDKTYANLNLGNTDFIGYYSLLDNDIVSLDAGVGYKKFDGSVRVYQDSKAGRLELTKGVLTGYANAEVGLPLTGLFAFAEVLAGLDESGIYDYQAGLGWQFERTGLNTKLRLGYRRVNFDVTNFDHVSADMKFDGLFAGVELTF